MVKIAPSILSADFSKLGDEIVKIDNAGADYIHIDVMDGSFVPNISFGTPIMNSIRGLTDKTFDVHLMIDEPIRYIDDFKKAGADLLCVHAEACKHLNRTIAKIKECNLKAAVALNPATSLSALDFIIDELDMVLIMSVNPGFGGQQFIDKTIQKVKVLRMIADRMGKKDLDIEVDGGVNLKNAKQIIDAGANVLVAGSAIFNGDVTANINNFKNI